MHYARRFDLPSPSVPRPSPATRESNRRNTERYVPVEDRAWIGWWDGSVFRTSEATLNNISQGGVLVEANTAPPRRSTVWICLEGPRRTEWVEGRILDISKREGSCPSIRIMFDEICPYAFFEVAVYGWQAARAAPIVTIPEDLDSVASYPFAMMSY